MEVTQQHQLDPNIKNHIVVCGIHSSIFHFLLPLRAKYLDGHWQHIVIIAPPNQAFPSDIWDSIARFPMIYIINGSPLNRATLRAANIKTAAKAVILSMDMTIKIKG